MRVYRWAPRSRQYYFRGFSETKGPWYRSHNEIELAKLLKVHVFSTLANIWPHVFKLQGSWNRLSSWLHKTHGNEAVQSIFM